MASMKTALVILVILIVAGVILPWLWLPALVLLFVWWRRRR